MNNYLHRVTRILALFAALAVLALVRTAAPHALAGPAAPALSEGQAQPSVVGTWLLSTGKETNLTTFFADGAFLTTNPPIQAPPPGIAAGSLFVTAGHGVWTENPDRSIAFTFVELEYDEQGHLAAITKISGTITVDDGLNTAAGIFAVQVTDPAGQVVGVGSGTLQLSRITVESSGQAQAESVDPAA